MGLCLKSTSCRSGSGGGLQVLFAVHMVVRIRWMLGILPPWIWRNLSVVPVVVLLMSSFLMSSDRSLVMCLGQVGGS